MNLFQWAAVGLGGAAVTCGLFAGSFYTARALWHPKLNVPVIVITQTPKPVIHVVHVPRPYPVTQYVTQPCPQNIPQGVPPDRHKHHHKVIPAPTTPVPTVPPTFHPTPSTPRS